MIPEIKVPSSLAKQLEDYLEFHMSNCIISLETEDELPEGWSSFGPYCGCFTCESREWLMATFTFLKNHGIVDLYVEDSVEVDQPTLFDKE